MNTKKLETIKDFVNFAERKFRAAKLYYGHGTSNARDEAVYLVLHALNLSPHTKEKKFIKKVISSDQKRILDLIARRVNERKPSAYLTNEAWFAGLPFYVDEKVLIPRSPIAELIEQQFTPWVNPNKVTRILDIGTGSGCIAIACAYAFPKARIDAIDVSSDALEVAALNVKNHKVGKQVKVFYSDVFSKTKNNKYDIIISNPPYVANSELKTLPAEYHHEPKLALAAGKKGLNIVDKIIHEAAKHLTSSGILIVEVGNAAPALVKKYFHLPFIWLTFSRGESEIFLLTKNELKKKGNQLGYLHFLK